MSVKPLDDMPNVLLLDGGVAEVSRGDARVAALPGGAVRIDAPDRRADLSADEASDLSACLREAARLQRICAAMRAAPPSAPVFFHASPRRTEGE